MAEAQRKSTIDPSEVSRRASAPSPPPRAATLLEEAALLREAQAALQAGDAQRSLEAISKLESQHPSGVLREERLAMRVLGLCAAGRVAEARIEGQRFLAEMPRSPAADRVRRSCALTEGDR